jgi:nitrogen fixation protein NifU and related proteins
MADLRDLYQEVILEHSKAPRNYRSLANANRKAEGFNPLCGDHFTVYLDVQNDSIRDIAFEGSGCAISKASASMMTQSLKGKSTADAEKLFDEFHKLVTQGAKKNGNGGDLGKLTVFSGVSEYPARVKCATLAWHALHAALAGQQDPVSTE